jgi:hypothetical protein
MMFEILSQFIEKECSPGNVDWEADEHHKAARKEMQELYEWWHQYYNKQYQLDCDTIWNETEKYRPNTYFIPRTDGAVEWNPQWSDEAKKLAYNDEFKKLQKLETKVEKELEVNLHRLIKIMPYMWT